MPSPLCGLVSSLAWRPPALCTVLGRRRTGRGDEPRVRLQEGSSWDLLSHAHTLSAAAVPSSPQMMQTQVKSDHRCTRATPFTLPNRIEVGQTVSSRLMLAFSL